MGHVRKFLVSIVASTAMIVVLVPSSASGAPPSHTPTAVQLVTGLGGGSGSTVGPDGALYVTEPVAGEVSRVDPTTGAVTTVATGLPAQLPAVGLGGAMDIAFIGRTAYVIVTLVGPDVGGNAVVGLYRIDDADSSTVVADIGQFALDNPPQTPFDVPTGVQYAMEPLPFGRGFLVTDGHHNRVLRVGLDGTVSEAIAFGNIVPTGLERLGAVTLMAEAGPVPHEPEDGRIVAISPGGRRAVAIASGAPLLVDVEFGPRHVLYALSQGDFEGGPAGSPAKAGTGALVRVGHRGNLVDVVAGLDRPTSVDFIGNAGYVVTLTGEIWKVTNLL